MGFGSVLFILLGLGVIGRIIAYAAKEARVSNMQKKYGTGPKKD